MANRRKTKEEFDLEISKKYNENLESIGFTTTKEGVRIRCKNCGYEKVFTKAANFLYCAPSERKGFCPYCRKEKRSNKWTHQDFEEEVLKRNPNPFKFISKYTNRDEIISAQCLKCNAEFSRVARAFLLGRDCPVCGFKKSHGENQIMKILRDHNIEFVNNYVLKGFDNRKSFDFKIDTPQGIKLIEYDGEQHFEYNTFLHRGDYNNFLKQQRTDEAKNEYCKEHNIPLLRIPYFQEVTEALILDFIDIK